MNPLTLVKRIQKINSKEAALGISDSASWHAKYKESAYVFVGGIPYDLTEGDLLAVFAQYGEIVDVNLVRDKGTGKSKGFAFVAYEDQRSTNLAVDNLNGAQILGRIVRVDHVSNYKKKEEEDEEEEQKKREARGVCYAFQKGECNRGSGCKFSHDEQRNRNTGWGPKDSSRWDNDRYDGPLKNGEGPGLDHKDSGSFREKGDQGDARSHRKRIEKNSRNQDGGHGRMPGRNEKEPDHKEEWDMQVTEERSARDEPDLRRREDHDRKGSDNRSTRDETESYHRKDYDKSGREVNRLARNRPESNPREDRNKRGREVDRSAWEGTDHDRSKGCDRSEREEERSRRHESGSYAREDRDQRRVEKRVAYERSPQRGR